VHVFENAIGQVRARAIEAFRSPVSDRALDELKFAVCLPGHLAHKVPEERTTDREGLSRVLDSRVRFVTLAES
jgi:hypothetical protein